MKKKVFAIIVFSIMALVLLVPMMAFAHQDYNDPCASQNCSDPCDTQCPEPECPPVQCQPEPECPPVQCRPEPECPPVQCRPEPECPPVQCRPEPECPPVQCCPQPECPPVQCCPQPECPPVQCCPQPECPPCQCSYEGLTPGYWKNHVTEWDCYNKDNKLGDVFSDVPFGLSDETLLDALKFHGGPELDGMARNMLRHAVAAMLNSCSSKVNYPYTMDEIISMVNNELEWGSRSSMEDLKDSFEAANELGLHS